MLELVDELVAGTATSGGGGSAPAVIEELNVTPSTSAQTITAPEGVDGYSPVNVSAVTSSIDVNITAGNIKSGVDILGVTGTLVEGDVITATNNTGTDILAGDKVWINESSGSYTLEDLSNTSFYESNLTPKGTPSIQTEVVASGFSASNYLQFSGTISNFTTENCTIYIKFKTGSSTINQQQLLCIDKSYINLFVQSGSIRSWDGSQAQNIASASSDTTYWVKFQTNGTNKSVSVSLDGQTYGTPVTFTDSTAGGNTILLEIGSYDYYPSWYFGGTVDLLQTYIKNADGDIVWRAIEDNPNTLTGFAKEIIQSGSSGEVLTVIEPKYYAYKDLMNRYVYCENIITSTQYYYNLNARSDNAKATSISELTVPSRAKPKSVSDTGAVTFNIMPYYRSEQDDLY